MGARVPRGGRGSNQYRTRPGGDSGRPPLTPIEEAELVAAFDSRYAVLDDPAAWVNAGFTLDDALPWCEEGFEDADEAAAWAKVTDPEDALGWWDQGWKPSEAAEYVNAGVSYHVYETSRDYSYLSELTPRQLGAWASAGYAMGDAAVAVETLGVNHPAKIKRSSRDALGRAIRDLRDGHLTVWRDIEGVDRPDREVIGAPDHWWDILHDDGIITPPAQSGAWTVAVASPE